MWCTYENNIWYKDRVVYLAKKPDLYAERNERAFNTLIVHCVLGAPKETQLSPRFGWRGNQHVKAYFKRK